MRVGIVGWRGMVGTVLMQRLQAEGDLNGLSVRFYSTSAAGQPAPIREAASQVVLDAHDLATLAAEDVILTAQGGDYTSAVHAPLRAMGWNGYWIDAASTLRMQPQAVLVLDPLNRAAIESALAAGAKDFVGANCTVSLMLLGLAGLFKAGLVDWITAMTYQAASGAGAAHMRELVEQMGFAHRCVSSQLADPSVSVLSIEESLNAALKSPLLPAAQFGGPLAGSLIPWIDADLGTGQSKEEWKGMVEANKILGSTHAPLALDGICVRVGAMRCHSQALTIKLNQELPLAEIEDLIAHAHPWVRLIANNREASVRELSPVAVSGTLTVPVGRLRQLPMGPAYLSAFTLGDQLLWGAAEPLRRMLKLLRGTL